MSDSAWSDDAILEQMRITGQELEAAAVERVAAKQKEGHLAFSRGRQLALNPAKLTEAERLHLGTCRSCSRLIAVFTSEMPHPSRWDILLWALGLGSAAAREQISQHVADDACEFCQANLRALQPVRTLLRELPPGRQLRDPSASLAASDSDDDIVVRSTDKRFEGDMYDERDSLTLEIHSRDASQEGQIVRFAMIGGDGCDPIIGFVIMRRDAEGQYVGTAARTAAELYDALGGQCSVLIAPVLPGELLAADRSAFLESVRRSDEKERATWKLWAERTESAEFDGIMAELAKETTEVLAG